MHIHKVVCYNFNNTGTVCEFIEPNIRTKVFFFLHFYTNLSWLITKSKVTGVSNCGVYIPIRKRVQPPNLSIVGL